MKPGRAQQALVGIGIFFVILATLMGVIIVALAEKASPEMALTPTTAGNPTQHPTEEPDAPTQEETSTRVATSVPRPTHRPTRTSTATTLATEQVTATYALTTTPCQVAEGWVPYPVQSGDTLFTIGWRYGVTVDTMLVENCLASTFLHAGDVIQVPPVTPRPLPTSTDLASTMPATDSATVEPTTSETIIPPTSSATIVQPTAPLIGPTPIGTLTATDGACSNPDSIITSPKVGELLFGTIEITGTARMPNFASYRLELRQEGTGQPFAAFMTGNGPVVNGLLAEIDTRQWPNGEYWMRLVVVDNQGNYPERCSILIAFYNCDCIGWK